MAKRLTDDEWNAVVFAGGVVADTVLSDRKRLLLEDAWDKLIANRRDGTI
jgi:hypothetical protein